jgi:GMP synthase-like glutamine amidotransferase
MGSILFARADAFETFGIGTQAVTDAGASIRVWEAVANEPAPSLDDVDGVVIFGSSFNVEHADEQPFIHALRDVTLETLDRELPFLGVCFGAQVLAWSLGAPIEKAPVREVGYVPLRPLAAAADDPVLGHYEDGDMVFEWHMDTFALPEGAKLLATGDDVTNQAYRLGDRTWATQFHFEIDRAEIRSWTDEVADTVEAEWGKSSAALLAEADRFQAAHERAGAEVFRRFVKVAQERR